jgi:hypothetical protein
MAWLNTDIIILIKKLEQKTSCRLKYGVIHQHLQALQFSTRL